MMPLTTVEIRWFSQNRQALWELFFNTEKQGEGMFEGKRSDFYLNASAPSTGIKIREGNHELKVKIAEDEKISSGIIQQWSKWSYKEEENILNSALLKDWIEVEKTRYKKAFSVKDGKLIASSAEGIEENCEMEFTKIRLPQTEYFTYTLGLEASGKEARQNLQVALAALSLKNGLLHKLTSCSYPEFLLKIL